MLALADVLYFHTAAELARSWIRSRGKTIASIQLEAVEAMKIPGPAQRFAQLNRLLVDVHHREKHEPHRAAVLRAALLDVIVEALAAWCRQDSVLAKANTALMTTYGEMRQRLDGDADFEAEVDVVRATLSWG